MILHPERQVLIAVYLLFGLNIYGQVLSPPGRGLGGPVAGAPPISPVLMNVAVPEVKKRDNTPPIARKEKKLIEPDEADLTEFRAILTKTGYGIVKLLDSKCPTQSDAVISVEGGCLSTVPGNGADFSFRRREHSNAETSDIRVKNGKFIVGSSFTQGLITAISNIELEKVEVGSDGIEYIMNFEPSSDIDVAKEQTAKINQGISDGKRIFSASTEIKVNQIYVVRSIAYRVGIPSEDKRCDIVVAFKVIRRDDDGNVTLIWKEMQKKESPKIALKK